MSRFVYLASAIAATLTAAAAVPASAGVTVTYENPGVFGSTAGFDWFGIEDFNARPTGRGTSFVSDFGTALKPIKVTGRYSNVDVSNTGQYGGASNSRYAETFSATGYTVALGTTDPRGINYFGYWLSALDNGNRLEFLNDGNVVYRFAPADVRSSIGNCPNAMNNYCGNPNDTPRTRVMHEQFAFVNLYFNEGVTYDAIRFFQSGGGGYESDNHTVGFFNLPTGNAVPEPATWAMLIAGFGLVGLAARRRRSSLATSSN